MIYHMYQDKINEWRWYLEAANGDTIADSGEGYKNKQDCLHGIMLVKASRRARIKEMK